MIKNISFLNMLRWKNTVLFLFVSLLLPSCRQAVETGEDMRNDNLLFNQSVEGAYELFAQLKTLSEKDRSLTDNEVQSIRKEAGSILQKGRGVSTDFMKNLDEDLAGEFRTHLLLSCRMYERLDKIKTSKLTETEAWNEFALWDAYWNAHAKDIKGKMLIPVRYTVKSYGLFAMYGIMLMVAAALIFMILRQLCSLMEISFPGSVAGFAKSISVLIKLYFLLVWSALMAIMVGFYLFRPEVHSWLYLLTAAALVLLPALYALQEDEKEAAKAKEKGEVPTKDLHHVYMLFSLAAFLAVYFIPSFAEIGFVNWLGKLIF